MAFYYLYNETFVKLLKYITIKYVTVFSSTTERKASTFQQSALLLFI